jgi:hypothetical protein
MNDKDSRSQLIAKIKNASSVLVTVSRDPNVDQLTAALALTFTLDKLSKHATAIFSGIVPPAINFLEPEKTFESSVDSLRDFVISLDKEKADRLRYKVEGDLVKIYITPYKTVISEKDLEFNEGDFNIELVVAIGVKDKEHLDEAITAHGGLLHDAAVATITLSDSDKTAFGEINWQSTKSSSLSEMVADLVSGLSDKDNQLLDEQVATALLTGVVAATDQFRNEKTSAEVMTLAANLMAKGANQQLIASELSAADGASLAASDADEPDKPLPNDESEPETLSIDRNFTPGEEKYLVNDTEKLADKRNQDALSRAQSELATLAERSENRPAETAPAPDTEPKTPPASEAPNPADLPSLPSPEPAPAATPQAEIAPPTPNETQAVIDRPLAPPTTGTALPTTAELPTLAPLPTPEPSVAGQNELDNLVASRPALSHSTPYTESATGFPLNSAVAGDEDSAPFNPLDSSSTVAGSPMISSAPPTIDLPPPPPPPTPDLGQLPPLPASSPTVTPNSLLDPALNPASSPAPASPEAIQHTGAPVSDPLFPNTADDPTQYQIPGQ